MQEILYFEIEEMLGKGKLEEALKFTKEKIPKDEIFLSCVRSRIFEKKGDYKRAFELSRFALEQAKKTDATNWFPNLVYLYALWRLGRYNQAIEHFKSIDISSYPPLIQARFHNIAGLIFWSFAKNPENFQSYDLLSKAKNEHEKALVLRTDHPIEKAFSHNNLGNTYLSLGLYDDALKQYSIARQIREAAGRFAELATTLRDIGRCFIKMERYEDARDIFLKALEIQRELNNSNDLAKIWLSLGEVDAKLKLNRYSKDFEIARDFAIKAGNDILLRKIEQELRKYQAYRK